MALEFPDEDPLEELVDVCKAILISNTRIYDALLAILGTSNEEAAIALVETHKMFKNIGPLPFLEGEDGTE